MIERPIFIVAPPSSGGGALLESLARSPGLLTARTEGAEVFDRVYELKPVNRDWDSNRLTAADAEQRVITEVRAILKSSLADRRGNRPGLDAAGLRWADASPASALRVPFLDAIWRDAYFVYVYRDPTEVVPEMLETWRAGNRVRYRDLPGWPGPSWSLPLVPGWRELAGLSLEEIVVEQWMRITRFLLSDLEALPRDRWCTTTWQALLDDLGGEFEKICAFLELEPAAEAVARVRADSDGRRRGAVTDGARSDDDLHRLLSRTDEVAARARDLLTLPTRTHRRKSAPPESSLRSVYTPSFPRLLDQLASSLLVSTYQTGKLVCARYKDGALNTDFRGFNRPMGLAAWPNGFVVGTRTSVVDFRNFPAVAPKLEPRGAHDACFLPRNKRFTGDIRMHEIAFAEGELWIVATSFSCLGTLDIRHSFVPRWTPPFITKLAPEDRCHLNGLCVVEDRVRIVTALGQSDVPGGWRETKVDGGVAIDVESGETVIAGLSMPHSPRWYEDRLWLLESGRGTLCVADLETGTVETIAELPGFTRGLAFAGGLAFVGLSQIRETATFGGLPLIDRLEERLCGVWAVRPDTGETVGFLRFEDQVQEIFDLVFLAGHRYPAIAKEGSDASTHSFALPDVSSGLGMSRAAG